jgi:flavin-binding protein dodecin
MSVARVIELSATSDEGFEAAINEGIKRATSTLRNVESAWVKDMNVLVEDNQNITYKVNLAINFVLEEGEPPASSG